MRYILGVEEADPAFYINEPLVPRRLCCPGCQMRISAQVTEGVEAVAAENVLA